MTVGSRGSSRPRRSRDRTIPSSKRSSAPASAWSAGTTSGGRRNGGRGSPTAPSCFTEAWATLTRFDRRCRGYVIVDRRVVAGSAYESDGRSALPDDPGGAPWAFASDVARQLEPPEDVYVMDVCEADGRLWLLELNPFSGADLYACRCDDVVAAVSAAALRRLA